MAKEGQKSEGMSVHEALSDKEAFLGFLKEERENLKGMSIIETTAEYLRSRGFPEETIENRTKLLERISESVEKAHIEAMGDLVAGFPRSLVEALAGPIKGNRGF